MKKLTSFIITLFAVCQIKAQEFKIDTLPFEINNLLIIKGYINDVETDFALDTGADVSCSNTSINDKANIKILSSSFKVVDANQSKEKVNKIKIGKLKIGSFEFNNFKALTHDMPFLSCNNYFLLGQDIIRSLNWKFDFEKKLVYISNKQFDSIENMSKWNITYKVNRPFINISIDKQSTYKCLIDFGFGGILDVDSSVNSIDEEYKIKKKLDKTNEYILSSVGLLGLSNPENNSYFLIDSIFLGKTSFKKVLANLKGNTDTKIGLKFFKEYCSSLILDFHDNIFYFKPTNQLTNVSVLDDAIVLLKNNKLLIIGKNIDSNSTSNDLEIGEEILSINNRKVNDFKDECDFLLWYTAKRSMEIYVEKMNGKKVIIKKSSRLN